MKISAKIKTYALLTVLSFSALSIFVSPSAHAALDNSSKTGSCSLKDADAMNSVSFFPAWYDGLYCSKTGGIVSPGDKDLGGNSGARFGTWLSIIAMNVVRLILYIVGYTSIGFIIYGGFQYITSGDNSSGTVSARKTIQNAVIGLVLSIASVSIVTFIVSRLVK